MSTTVSIGVWSVIVIGAISRIFFNFSGWGIICWVESLNRTNDSGKTPSIVLLAFSKIICILIF